jgi:asparagine synthase (glutamine-hydrolysing)
MCGIVGIHSLNGRRPIDLATLEAMNRTIVHRGPDSDGRYEDPGHVGLAMRRLSIIDVSGGDQPISNEDGTVWTVFNGEIYNFRELRRNLQSRGHRFRTATDTEVIVHAYEEFGDDFVQHCDGMFTFALWDSRQKRLILARDRWIKQLYYSVRNGQLIWGSEIK